MAVASLAVACSASTDGGGDGANLAGAGGSVGVVPGAGGAANVAGGTAVPGGGGSINPVGGAGAPVGVAGSGPMNGGGAPPVGGGGSGPGPGGDGSVGGAPPGAGGGTFHSPPCNLNTGYAGDDECILPPPADKGFQLHVGPTDYKNPGVYLMQPGQEATDNFPATSGNTGKIYFYFREYRFRPTAHHVIITTTDGGGGGTVDITGGRRIGTANRSEDFPVGGIIPPENKDVGIPLNAHVAINTSFHAINTDTEPQLREMWVNFWYRDPAEVKQSATEWFDTGSMSFAIPPNAKMTLGPYTCTIQGDGHLLWLYGHRHANNTRFTVSRIRGTQTDVIYDANKWEEPLLLEYASTVTNPPPDPTGVNEGGWSGVLDLKTNDKIQWSCNIENKQNTTLRFTNNTYTGEMCIVDAEAVASNCVEPPHL